jgi:hypothetical protein
MINLTHSLTRLDCFFCLSFNLSALFIPPKAQQAYLQGGTFVFDENDRTVFAHYDPSTAAHARVEDVMRAVYDMNNNKKNDKEPQTAQTATPRQEMISSTPKNKNKFMIVAPDIFHFHKSKGD